MPNWYFTPLLLFYLGIIVFEWIRSIKQHKRTNGVSYFFNILKFMINYSHYNKLPYKMSNDIIIHHLLIDHRYHLLIIVYYSCLLFVKITPWHCQQSGIYLQLGTEVSFIDHFYNLRGLALVNIRVSMEVICFWTGCAFITNVLVIIKSPFLI